MQEYRLSFCRRARAWLAPAQGQRLKIVNTHGT
jgi:hypothetical protein